MEKENFCIGDCQEVVDDVVFIGQYPVEMGCYNYIFMCKKCINKFILKYKYKSK